MTEVFVAGAYFGVSLEQSLIDVFIVSLIALLTPR